MRRACSSMCASGEPPPPTGYGVAQVSTMTPSPRRILAISGPFLGFFAAVPLRILIRTRSTPIETILRALSASVRCLR